MKHAIAVLAVLLFAGLSFAQQAPNDVASKVAAAEKNPGGANPAPALTDAEKVEILKLQKQQSDVFAQEQQLQAQAQARYQQLEQQKTSIDGALAAKLADAGKKAGAGWTLNPDTLEFVKLGTPPAAEKK